MTVFNNYLLERINSNTSEGIINLREENIGDEEVEALGKVLQNNNTVWSIQLPREHGNITDKGLKFFVEKIALRKELLVVEANNGPWNEAFRYIEESKRLGQEVDKLADFLPINVQNDKSASDLTDSSKSTTSLALEEDNVVEEVPVVEELVKAAPVVELVDKAEEAKEGLVELELTKSVESLLSDDSVDGSVDDSVNNSVNVVLESFYTSYQENPATISPNDIKSVKIKPTSFFAKISNAFTTMKDTLTSLFNHNTTKDYYSSKFYVTKEDMFQEDTDALGCVDDMSND